MKSFILKITTLFFATIAMLSLSGCGSDGDSTTYGSSDTIESIQLSTADGSLDVTVPVGTVGNLIAIAVYSDQTTKVITSEVIYTPTNSNVVNISQDGSIKAIKSGSTDITASLSGVTSDKVTFQVNAAILKSISIVEVSDNQPVHSSSSDEFVVGEKLYTKAMGTYSDNTVHDITNISTWTSTNEQVSVTEDGVITALLDGPATVNAKYSGITGSVSGTVVTATPTGIILLSDREVTTLPAGVTLTLKAFMTFDNGQSYNITQDAIWKSSDKAITVNKGVVNGTDKATATISVDHKGVSESIQISYTKAVISSLEIQESYCADGSCPVVSSSTVDLTIVDAVDNADPNTYYPTTWATYSDGSKFYVNQEAHWWSDNMIEVYVNGTQGSYVYGRGITNTPATITTRFRGHEASFKANVSGKINETLLSIKINHEWNCTAADIGNTLTIDAGLLGRKVLHACGEFRNETTQTTEWRDINAKVARWSSERDVLRVGMSNSEILGMPAGAGKTAIAHFQYLEKTREITVSVQ